MSRDCRDELISRIRMRIGNMMEAKSAAAAVEAVIRELANYEITERETAIVKYDDTNERILKRYCACLRIDGKSEGTIYQYRRTCRKLAEQIPKTFTEMGVYDIRYFLAMMKETGIKNSTLETARANLSAFFQWLTMEDLIRKNPCMNIKPIKCADEIRKPFTDTEIDALRSACRTKKERAILETLLASGIRVAELRDLNLRDIEFDRKIVHVLHGKGDKERTTYLTGIAVKHLQEYLRERKTLAEPVFLNRTGERITVGGVRFILNRIAERAGVDDVHPHRFRRTFASGLASRGMDVQDIQKLLGHSNINTTMVYVHTDQTAVAMSYQKYAI